MNHCKWCGYCQYDMDHHCVYISNCISKYNYKYYFGFCLSTAILSLYDLIYILYPTLAIEEGLDFKWLFIVILNVRQEWTVIRASLLVMWHASVLFGAVSMIIWTFYNLIDGRNQVDRAKAWPRPTDRTFKQIA